MVYPTRKRLAGFFGRVSVRKDTGCWEWTGARSNGYGMFRNTTAHRWAHLWFVGDIPSGYHVDHLCRNRACVNPAHLEAVTMRENIQRYWNKERPARLERYSLHRKLAVQQRSETRNRRQVIRSTRLRALACGIGELPIRATNRAAVADIADREAQLIRSEDVVFGSCDLHAWRAVRDGGQRPECPLCHAAREAGRDLDEYVRRVFSA